MLCKPLFIIHVRVKVFLRLYWDKNEVPQLQKWAWHMHNKIVAINVKFQASVQINKVLLYNKKV